MLIGILFLNEINNLNLTVKITKQNRKKIYKSPIWIHIGNSITSDMFM
jgi:hypothetical protein